MLLGVLKRIYFTCKHGCKVPCKRQGGIVNEADEFIQILDRETGKSKGVIQNLKTKVTE